MLHQEDKPAEQFGFEGQHGFLSGDPEHCGKQRPHFFFLLFLLEYNYLTIIVHTVHRVAKSQIRLR